MDRYSMVKERQPNELPPFLKAMVTKLGRCGALYVTSWDPIGFSNRAHYKKHIVCKKDYLANIKQIVASA